MESTRGTSVTGEELHARSTKTLSIQDASRTDSKTRESGYLPRVGGDRIPPSRGTEKPYNASKYVTYPSSPLTSAYVTSPALRTKSFSSDQRMPSGKPVIRTL